MKTRARVLLPSNLPVGIAAACWAITFLGCQQPPPPPPPPATNWSGGVTNASGLVSYVGATVDTVGPGRWCYTIESFSLSQTNALGGPDPASPIPGNPHGHPDGIAFTNLAVSAPHCAIANVPHGWKVQPGSTFVLIPLNNSGDSKIQFCLDCDATNGTITINVTDRMGNQVTVGPVAGPQ